MNILDIYKMGNFLELSEEYKKKPDVLIEEFVRLKELCIHLDTIIENSIDGIFITDGNANVIRVNKSYEIISGIKREEIIGMNMHEFETNNYISQSATLLTLKRRQPVTIDQILYRTKRKALVSCNPLFNKDNVIIMVVSNVRDITELELLKKKIQIERERIEKYQSTIEAIKAQLFEKSDIVSKDHKFLELLRQAKKVAAMDTTVLITGETGVGKEVIAKYIHENSKRAKEHFIKVNCGAIVSTLIESELFGYEKGAFTGAKATGKTGLFEVADKGTIFLDEIGEMPLDMQVRLLRVIQEREIERIGSTKPIKINVRIIAATNRDLSKMVEIGKFREDLYYRLNVVPIVVPSLRERSSDIEPLVNKFIEEFNNQYGLDVKITKEAIDKLKAYSWPGNVRELKNIVERTIILCNSNIIYSEDIPLLKTKNSSDESLDNMEDLKSAVDRFEYGYIKKAYEKYGSVRDAANFLKMKRSTYANKLKEYKEKFDD